MNASAGPTPWLRRAQPLLGTLVEIGVHGAGAPAQAAVDAGFAAVRAVQACLSRFEADSDIARFHALPVGATLCIRPSTRHVLAAAADLQRASDGAFDISLGSAPDGWRCNDGRLHKLSDAVRLDLGGIGKGHAVDCAAAALIACGCRAGWVNAGGDLRAFGDVELPVRLRDEARGGTRLFAALRDGAFATSHFDPCSRSRLARRRGDAAASAHISVAAPQCLWADALTKIVALSGDAGHPLLARFEAQAWRH